MARSPHIQTCGTKYALLIIFAFVPTALAADDSSAVLVGMRGRLEGVVLGGPELEVRPLEDSQAPFVLRITDVHTHGNAFRYDFVYYALEPRTYDLTQYLRPKDGVAGAKLPPLEVKIEGTLGPGLIHPHPLVPKPAGWFGAYHLILITGLGLWFFGFLLLLFWGQRRKTSPVPPAPDRVSVADRLRPLVIRAMTGMLSPKELAELERTLIAFWRHRLGLEEDKASTALAKMRSHPEAGALLGQLELWLHKPGTADQVEVGKLLWPYQLIGKELSPEGSLNAAGGA